MEIGMAQKMEIVLGYCDDHNIPCWVIRTLPQHAEKSWGGTSARLIAIGDVQAMIEIANGDRSFVPIAELTMHGV